MFRNTSAATFRARLGGLRWRLTVVYALVTLVAAGTMSAATAVAQTVRGVVPADQAGVPAILAKSAGAAAPYLAGPAPDPETIRMRVTMPLMDDLARQAWADPWAIAVFDSQGTLLAADSCPGRRAAIAPAACRTEAQSRAAAVQADRAVQSAVRDRAGHVRTGTASGRGFAAATIPGAEQPGGAIVAIFDGGLPATPRRHLLGSFLAQWTSSWSPAWLPLIVVAILLGTGAGLALSHRLVRRIRAIALTTAAWSQGDLEPTVDTRGGDELARLGADLNHMAEQIRNLLATRHEMATVQERHRVQRDLHDGVKQELFAASLHLAAARAALSGGTGEVLGPLAEAEVSYQRARRELTTIIEQLRPSPLSARDLAEAVAELGAEFERRSGVAVTCDLPASGPHLTDPVQEALLRIVQEALTNIRRHAAARTATIRIAVHDDHVALSVSDDGCGLPADLGDAAGLGLTSMRERAAAVGGSFRIDPAHPAGTRIEVVLPTAGQPTRA